MPDTADDAIIYETSLSPLERRTAVLATLEKAGRLDYLGPRGDFFVVNRGGKEEALSGDDVDRLEFNGFVGFADAATGN